MPELFSFKLGSSYIDINKEVMMIPAESFYIREGSSYNPVSKVKYTRILFKPLHEYTRRNNTIWLKLRHVAELPFIAIGKWRIRHEKH